MHKSAVIAEAYMICLHFQWLDTIVLNWLTRIYNQGSSRLDQSRPKAYDVLKDFRVKLEYYLYQTYADNIIEQFFNIIIGMAHFAASQMHQICDLIFISFQISRIHYRQSTISKNVWTNLI